MSALTSAPITRLTLEKMINTLELAGPAVDGIWWDVAAFGQNVHMGTWTACHIPGNGRERSDTEIDAIMEAVLGLVTNGTTSTNDLAATRLRDIDSENLWTFLADALKRVHDIEREHPVCQNPVGGEPCGFPAEPGRIFCQDCDPYRHPRSIAHNANARTGVMLGELRDV